MMVFYGLASSAMGQLIPESSRFLEYPLTLPGGVTKAQKIHNEATGQVSFVNSLGNAISVADLKERETSEANARQASNGKLSGRLASKVLSLGLLDQVKVAIYMRYPPISYPDKTQSSREEQQAASLAAANIAPVLGLGDLAIRHGLSLIGNRGEGIGICQASKLQLLALKLDPDIAVVEEENDEERLSPELSTLAASAYNPGSVPSGAGAGVHASTFEYGISSTFLSCIGVTPSSYDTYTTTDLSDIRHSEGTFRCLAAAAPSASFYHRNSQHYDATNDVNYLINNSIQTVSISISRGGTTPYHSNNSEFLVMDDFAYRSPYPVFITPTANAGYQNEVNWQGYNAISVGNVRHTNNSTYEFADCTQTKNPPPIYGSCISGSGANCAGDREMPYIVAPGIPSSGTDFATTCLEGATTQYCGTSWSAPIANGMAADIIAADSRLSGWPEKVRATMILTAQNVDGGYWNYSSDGRDGSGVVSGSEGVSFAQNHTSVSPGNTAVQKGMTAGSWYAADFSSGNKRFYIAAPNPLPSGKHLRAVLTWDSNPVVGGTTNALSDLDLIVQMNSGTTGSYSWDGNVEVVDVANSNLTGGNTYYLDVAPVFNRIPASGSRTNYFYYSVAWEWVIDHAN